MELIRGDYSLPANPGPCVAAIGGFDSLHLGHQTVIKDTLSRARAAGLPGTVVFFEPLPFEFFNEDAEGACTRVNLLRSRVSILTGLGVPRALCLRFDRRVAAMTAGQFIEQVLVSGLAVRHVVVGEGFRFGRLGAGTVETLREGGRRRGFSVSETPTVTLDGERVSSSLVRTALSKGDIAEVERQLARPYVISAKVGRGMGRGAVVGFPTANLIMQRRSPLRGVFAADARIERKWHRAVVNAGEAPTFGGRRYRIEVHALGLRERLYAKRLDLRLLEKIRDERKFTSVEQLRKQIETDIEAAAAVGSPLRTQPS